MIAYDSDVLYTYFFNCWEYAYISQKLLQNASIIILPICMIGCIRIISASSSALKVCNWICNWCACISLQSSYSLCLQKLSIVQRFQIMINSNHYYPILLFALTGGEKQLRIVYMLPNKCATDRSWRGSNPQTSDYALSVFNHLATVLDTLILPFTFCSIFRRLPRIEKCWPSLQETDDKL